MVDGGREDESSDDDEAAAAVLQYCVFRQNGLPHPLSSCVRYRRSTRRLKALPSGS